MTSPRAIDNLAPGLRRFWHPVARSTDLGPDPLRVTLLGEDYVVFRMRSDDRPAAFRDSCPHRGIPLSTGSVHGDEIECPYHGMRFDGSGTCTRIPWQDASLPIPSKADAHAVHGVVERYGLVWIAIEAPLTDIPILPEWDDPTLHRLPRPLMECSVSAAQWTENLLDITHVPVAHAGLLANPSDTMAPEYELTREKWGLSFEIQNSTRDPRGEDRYETRRVHYRLCTPFVMHITFEYPSSSWTVFLAVQPATKTTSRAFGYYLSKDAAFLEGLVDLQRRIGAQDVAILESFPAKELIVDLQGEFHTPADKVGIELRRIMRDVLDLGADIDDRLTAFADDRS